MEGPLTVGPILLALFVALGVPMVCVVQSSSPGGSLCVHPARKFCRQDTWREDVG